MSDLEAELESNRRVLGTAAADLAAARRKLAARQQEAVGSSPQLLAEMEQQQEQSRGAIMEAAASASNLRNCITQAEERMAALDREAQRLQPEMALAIRRWRLRADGAGN